VDHLHVVAGPVFTNVSGAGYAAFDWFTRSGAVDGLAGFGVDFGRDGFPNRFKFVPSGFLAAGHERGAEASAFFAAGNAGANEAEAFIVEFFFATDGVGPESVAAVDDDIVWVEQFDESVNDSIGCPACLYENDDLAWTLERLNELFERLGSEETAWSVGISATKASVLDVVRLKTEMRKPWSAMLRARF